MSMPPILKLIRIQNLGIIALSMYLFKYCIMLVFIKASDLSIQLPHKQFFLLVLATVLIAAAGYIINDYNDVEIDLVNKPNKVVIGKGISKSQALNLYWIFNVLGLVLAYFVALKLGVPQMAFIHAISIGLLWFYSSEFKKMFLIGNVIVALLSAIVFLLPAMFEIPLLIKQFKKVVLENEELFLMYKQIPLAIEENFKFIWYWSAAYAAFAFVVSLCRELIKDCEDLEGDERFGATTLAVKLGTNVSNKIVAFLLFCCFAGLAYLSYIIIKSHDYYSFAYISLCILLPLLWIIKLVWNAYTKEEYAKISQFLKLLMIMGIAYTLVFKLIMK